MTFVFCGLIWWTSIFVVSSRFGWSNTLYEDWLEHVFHNTIGVTKINDEYYIVTAIHIIVAIDSTLHVEVNSTFSIWTWYTSTSFYMIYDIWYMIWYDMIWYDMIIYF